MAFEGKRVTEITQADLEALIPDVPEGKALDYKRDAIGRDDQAKREFLHDVTSFANTIGGHIIFGMDEEEGAACELRGLEGVNADAEVLRLEQIVAQNVQPRIQGFEIAHIQLDNGNTALVIRIPRSYQQPHMVSFRGSQRFFGRNSAGKYALDVTEIRNLFAASDALIERIRGHRRERLDLARAGKLQASLSSPHLVMLHLVPFSALDAGSDVDLEYVRRDPARLLPIFSGSFTRRFNFDGFITFAHHTGSDAVDSYAQLFRNGIIEAVTADLLSVHPDTKRLNIPSFEVEVRLIEAVQRFSQTLGQLGVSPPYAILLTLTGVKGAQLGVKQGIFPRGSSHIDRQDLIFPEVVIHDLGQDVGRTLKPVFDALWNAVGFPGSDHYDADGNWVGERRG